jgi:glycerophosphoryl diester phosphodiesterase
MSNTHFPWCIAHRGARQEAPENTWSAFQRALAYPIDGIEFDVQMSADGTPIVYHDRTLWRVARRRAQVSQWPFDQLAPLAWGAWFAPAFRGEPLLTLETALEKLVHCPRLLIEIKSRPVDQASGHAYRLTERVVGLVRAARQRSLSNRILILSFDPQVLDVAHKLAPDLRCVLNVSEEAPLALLDHPPIAPALLWAVCVKISHLSAPLVQWAKKHRLNVFTYTCNGPRQVQKALKLNADAILSDRPGWLTQYVKGEPGA